MPPEPARLIAAAMAALAFANAAADEGNAAQADGIERGRYLVTIMECAGCHTTGTLRGQRRLDGYLAGSETGLGGVAPQGATNGGAVFPPNLTPDRETGLGSWTDEQIGRAIRFGQRPDGRILSPVMPWPIYGNSLSEADARSIVAYLRTIPTVRYKVPENFTPGEPPTGPYLVIVGP
ncbi:MAG: c-type cytochrome [Gammaproteobacteria bacterium]|nr:c-type cytochrome [Gammaproteobacteria bacterium]